ncbi:MAG TPA: orotidine-5'-phosphate decarboxylase [Smithella sp.]|nr:orotidine-5'-phosphate decarboxylase [Smithella sp.]
MKNTSNKAACERLIFALDASSYDDALEWLDLLSGHVGMFKVGKELFTAAGPDIVRAIKERGQKVFLDLKYHDIPNTVARAAEAAVHLGVDMFNVHASGGIPMIRESVVASAACCEQLNKQKPIILAVTVLTSLNDDDLKAIGFSMGVKDLVVRLAKMAQEAGASGVVASPLDVSSIREHCGKKFIIVTPGIRGPDERNRDDQKRTLSAAEAIKAGADYLVVGRPIRRARDPLEACARMIDEIAAGMRAAS